MLFFGKYLLKRGLIATPLRHISLVLHINVFSLLLARFRTYASSYASFANSPAGFYQIRTWMLWKLPGTRLFRVGWKKHLACLCFSTLNKKFELKFERISLPDRGIEPGSFWSKVVRSTNRATEALVIGMGNLVHYIF